MRFLRHIVVLAAVLFPLRMQAAEDAAALQTQATQLYKHNKVRDACRLFERASKLAPDDGTIWADLGLCLSKLQGRSKDALTATLNAVRLGDEKTRKAAYFNLHSLGHVVERPELEEEFEHSVSAACRVVQSTPQLGCTRKMLFCSETSGGLGYHGYGSITVDQFHSCSSHCRAPKLPLQTDGDPGYGEFCEGEEKLPGICSYDAATTVEVETDDVDENGEKFKSYGVGTASMECRVVAIDACNNRIGVVCVSEENDPKTIKKTEVSERPLTVSAPPSHKSTEERSR